MLSSKEVLRLKKRMYLHFQILMDSEILNSVVSLLSEEIKTGRHSRKAPKPSHTAALVGMRKLPVLGSFPTPQRCLLDVI
jgi:hypothetical protein